MNNKQKNKFIVVLCIAFGAAVIFLFLLYKYYAPFGKAVSYKFTLNLPGAEEITKFSTSKDSVIKIPSQIIRTGQSRLSLTLLSKDIQSVNASLKYKKGLKEITLGVRGTEKDPFLVKPLHHSWLQNLDWEKIEENDFTLWQRNKKYSTLKDFVNNPPPANEVASYYIDADRLARLQLLQSEKQESATIETPLRGNHSMLVRITHAPFSLLVSKQDLNGYLGEDVLEIAVLNKDKTIAEASIEDDGIVDAGGLKLQPQEKAIKIENVEPGIYKVNFTFSGKNADSLISKISVNQKGVIFTNSVFILGSKPTTLFTNANNITVQTFHDSALQSIKLDDKKNLILDKSLKDFTFDLKSLAGEDKQGSLYKLESPKNDIVLKTDGYFAFSKNSFFDRNIISGADINTLEDWDGINFVLTTWQKAKQQGDWLVSNVSFDPQKIHIDGDKLYFSLDMPDFAKSGGELEIDSLDIEVKSDGVLSKTDKTKKEEAKPASTTTKKPNVFSRFFAWIGDKVNAVKGFFGGIVTKITSKKPTSAKPTPVSPVVGSPTLKPSPSPTAVPIATPSAIKYDLLVRVLNGGGEKGSAASAAAILKNNGFTNVNAGNADRFDYAGVTIQYRKEDITIADKIEGLLKKEYGTVTKTLSATTTAEAVVILGKK